MSTIDIVNFTLHIGLKTEAYQNYYEQLLALDASLTLLVGGGGVRIAIYTNIIGGQSFSIFSIRLLFITLYSVAEVAAAYVRKSGKQTGKFSRKIRNLCKNQEL
jgi:hypothetical protein